ncbi:MAG TPA: hypothetical protein VK550_16040 [Polyangiaceae bacterium]|nr:hypothetical protein [Polyangiaceae bacterium]
MDYWMMLFTDLTWREFQAAGGVTVGFRERSRTRTSGIRCGDVLLCYMVGAKRWVGMLEVAGEQFTDTTAIFSEEVFPVRFSVKPLVMLDAEHGVPMEDLCGKLSFFEKEEKFRRWPVYVRASPSRYKSKDGDAIATAMRAAEENPVSRPVEPRRLKRRSL